MQEFKRAIGYAQKYHAHLRAGLSIPRILELIGAYESRGHGQCKFSGKFDARRMGRHSGRKPGWPESGCGTRECARRRRQLHHA